MSKGGDPPKNLFIISPIGSEKSTTRGYFDKVRRHIIDPIAQEMGYRPIRADEISRPGTITNHIIEHLRHDDLVVADLTEMNPNVFYELAVRHAVKKPVILMGKKGDRIPFDLAAQRVIFYDLDPDNIEQAKIELMRQISEVNSDTFIVDSPIEAAISLETTGPVTEESQMQEVLSILRNLSERLYRIENVRTRITEVDPFRAIMLSKTEASPGELITLSGVGCTSGGRVSIFLDHVQIGYMPVTPNGTFVTNFEIPLGMPPGTHDISCIDDITNAELVTRLIIK